MEVAHHYCIWTCVSLHVEYCLSYEIEHTDFSVHIYLQLFYLPGGWFPFAAM